jgi:hypothetical protein
MGKEMEINGETKLSSAFSNVGKSYKDIGVVLQEGFHANQSDESSDSWDKLDADDKALREGILLGHFPKALERFNAGVSLAKIRRHYEKLGAKYSPVTFRKKWDELVKKHTRHV